MGVSITQPLGFASVTGFRGSSLALSEACSQLLIHQCLSLPRQPTVEVTPGEGRREGDPSTTLFSPDEQES